WRRQPSIEARVQHLEVRLDRRPGIPLELQHETLKRGDEESGQCVGVQVARHLALSLPVGDQLPQEPPRRVHTAPHDLEDSRVPLRLGPELDAHTPPPALTSVLQWTEERLLDAPQGLPRTRPIAGRGQEGRLTPVALLRDGFDDVLLAREVVV